MTPNKKILTAFVFVIVVFSLFAVPTSSVDSEPETSKEETSTGNSLSQTDDFAGGNGTESDPYQISNWTHLDNIRNNLTENFILVNNLDNTTNGYNDLASETANNESGWNPIGDSDNPFTGTFDGQNYTVSDLFIDRIGEDNIALFEELNNGGVIKNLNFLDVDVTGGDIELVAGLVGWSGYDGDGGIIENCYVEGTINAEDIQYVGGLVGQVSSPSVIRNSSADVDVTGDIEVGGLVGSSDATIIDCHTEGSVVANTYYSGGLVGNNGGDINNSYSDADVSGETSQIGGFVGMNQGNILNSYATGDIFGSSTATEVGGLVGKNRYSGEIYNSYSIGNIEGDDNVGLLVGENTWKIYDSIALDREGLDLIGYQEGILTGRVTNATEEDMKDIRLYTNDDFKDYEPLNESWDIHKNLVTPEEGNSYPYHNSTWSIDQVYYELNISSTVGGSVTQPGEGIFEYKYNTTVELDGIVDSGFTFKEWTGDNGTIENTTSLQTNITILDNYTITAEFTHNINFYNPDPPDGAENVSTELQLSIDVYHDLGEEMLVEFYDQEDNLIGSEDGILNETASVNYPDLEYNTTYTWYVMATSENDTRESQEFTFTTELESIDFKIETHAPLDDYVRPTEPIKLKFNREANLTSLQDGFSFNDGTDVYNISDVSFSWQSDYNVAVFDPHENFEQQTYNVIIKESVQAESGNETLDDDYIYNFTVGDFVNPTVNISVEPNFEDTYVHTIIYLNFSEPMNKTSVNESLNINVEYTSGWADMWFYKESLPEYELIWTSNSSAEVHFDEHLQPSSMYNITVSNNATDLAIEPNTLDGNHNTFHSTEFHTEWRIPAYIVYFILMIGLFIGIKMLIQIVQDNKLFRGEEV